MPKKKIHLTVDTGRSASLYLDLHSVAPLDVLLTRGSKPHSQVIAKATNGRFSHAALVVSMAALFEADSIGTGYTPLLPHRAERTSSGNCRLLSRLDGISDALLLRHPELQDIADTEAVQERLQELLFHFGGLEYPQLVRLAETLAASTKRRSIARTILSFADTMLQNNKVVPGPFCSQLVAAIYDDLGMPCFDPTMAPENVSPNSFLNSALECQDGAICRADLEAENDLGFIVFAQAVANITGFMSRKGMTAPMATLRKIVPTLEQAVKNFIKLRELHDKQ